MPPGAAGAENALTGAMSKNRKAAKIKPGYLIGEVSGLWSGDIKKTDMGDQFFFRIDFASFLNAFNADPFIVPVPAVESHNAVAEPIR